MGLQSRIPAPPEGAICVYSERKIDGFAHAIADSVRSQIGAGDPSDVKLLGVTPEGLLLTAKVLSLLEGTLVTDDQYDTVTFKNRQLPGTNSHAIDPRGTSLPPVTGRRVHLLLARERSGFSRTHLTHAAIAAGSASVHTSVMLHQPTNSKSKPHFAAETIDDPNIRMFGFGIPLLSHLDLGYESDYATLPGIYMLPRREDGPTA